ncbi:Phosphatidylinositol 4-phosphate 5-kinase 7 [Hibiscus syriacus]|uniref:1-phosphatidylinositol-4-phosphate 5-kinase n=1 Tax=Hibiscus syriacus TaxID=106335 RepID=A0A6A3B5B5_HIBSY|nr:Phosphatidylinositol 4-phosphate 5-kinase 7 [Hibiscus syriacus]
MHEEEKLLLYLKFLVVTGVSNLTRADSERQGHVSCIDSENVERLSEKTFPNGDVYVGDFKEIIPHGKGKYTWSNGTVYEASDGFIYEGQWRMNIRHGFGRKKYSNSDIYEGEWKEGVHEVKGAYFWNDVMASDIGYYFGTWTRGLKDGKGVFYPAGSRRPSLKKYLRELFKLDAAEYMMPICGDDGLTEISSPGKSGSLFYLSHDDKFVSAQLQITVDSAFLKSQQIIDYSLLLGLHFRAPEQLNGLVEPPNMMLSMENSLPGQDGEVLFPSKGLVLLAHEPSSVNTDPGPHIRGRALRAFSLGDKEVDVLVPGTGRLRVQLGVNMPAQATRKLSRDESDSAEVVLFEVYDVVLYMGIIDILQEYNAKKKAEHACKSVKFDPTSISVVETELYAKRFTDFLEQKVFPEQP